MLLALLLPDLSVSFRVDLRLSASARDRSRYQIASCPQPALARGCPPAHPIDARRFTLRQRIVLRIIIWLGYGIIRLIGPTLRVSVSYEEGAQKTLDQRPLIASFWHSCMIPATYICRDMGIRVMSSNSYDGEYMGRIIHKFGFVAVKGSSSRNAVRALLGLRRALEEGWTVAFTLDGPRGPRHKVKPGPVALARSSGLALTMFHAAVDQGLGAEYLGSPDDSSAVLAGAGARSAN